jgi:hypothetical protein
LAALVALFGLAACGKVNVGGGSDEMSWARAALERNDKIEIVATDPATNTFTIRIKDTGDLRTVRADQVVATPPGVTAATTGAAGGAAAPSNSAPADSATASNTEPTAPGSETQSAAPGAATASPNGSPAVASNSPPGGAANDAAANSPGQAAPPPSVSVPRTGYQPSAAPVAEVPNPNSDVASITPGGRVLESGTGYAIKAASGKSAPQVTAAVERSSTTSAIERRHDPIICQGQRLLHIDNRNIEFDEDAVAAEDGCEIYITNSHIIAKGVGVSARRALVHIDNSQIEGDTASIDASEGAQVYVESSTFKGVSRRLDNSSFHDLGGNVWN